MSDGFRRISALFMRPGQGPFTETRAAVCPAQWKLIFMLVCDRAHSAKRAIAAIGRLGIVQRILAGNTRGILGQFVGDREPGRLVDDKRVRVGAEAGIVIKRR
jgi:hypothetical protein